MFATNLYQTTDNRHAVRPERLIAEDSDSGFQFFQGVCEKNGRMTCISAHGKSNIFSVVIRHLSEKVLVVADGAAFGSEMEKLMRVIKNYPNITLYLPESFEWLILRSGVIEDSSLREMLKNPENYIESGDYFSWERYFTSQLIRITQDSYLRYAKRKLNPAYLQEKIFDRILAVMQGINLNSQQSISGELKSTEPQ